jgi:hypothetical protein
MRSRVLARVAGEVLGRRKQGHERGIGGFEANGESSVNMPCAAGFPHDFTGFEARRAMRKQDRGRRPLTFP